MSTQVSLRCRCGKLRGVATEMSPSSTNRLVCYCASCQAFARFLERDDVMDAAGGTDIVHMAPARLRITEGESLLRSMRLSSKGLLRWYTDCCRTPVGNTINARMPFVGLVHSCMDLDAPTRDEVLGKPRAFIHGKDAIGGVPDHAHATVSLGVLARIVRLLAGWSITGKGAPSPFFESKSGAPRVAPRVLSVAERDALRPQSASPAS